MYEVWSVTGEPLHRSGAAVRLPPIGEFAGSSLRYDRLVIDGRSWRMLAAPASIDSRSRAPPIAVRGTPSR